MEGELILDKNGFLVLQDSNDFDINIKLWWKSFNFNNEYWLVYHKGNFLIKRIVEIGDSMIFLKFLNRPEMYFHTIHKEAFIMWMWVFQEFDEDSGTLKSYLYKFDKWEIQEFNEVFSIYWIQDCKVRLDWKFVLLDYEIPSFNSIKDQVLKWIDNKCYNEIMSFMYWLSLVYGNLHIDQWDFKSIKMHIPLIWWLFNQKDFFDLLFNYFWTIWIPNKVDLQIQKIGHIFQVTFLDWEILSIFSNYLIWLNEINQVSKILQVNNIKDQLFIYLKDSNTVKNKSEIISLLERRVIKLIEK